MLGISNTIKVIAGCLAILIIALVVHAASQVLNAKHEREALSQLLFDIETQESFYSTVNRNLGYGGFIHNFKNYVLRKDPIYLERSEQALGNFESTIFSFVREHPLNESEFENLRVLQETVMEYRNNLALITSMVTAGATTEEIDQAVKVDDTAAFAALDFFSATMRANFDRYQSEAIRVEAIETTANQSLIFSGIFSILLFGLMSFVIRAGLMQSRMVSTEVLRTNEMLDASSEAFIAVNTNQNIVSFNKKAEELFGWTKEEILGRPLDLLISAEGNLNHDENVEHYFHSKHSEKSAERLKAKWREVFALRKNGTTFPVEINLSKFSHDGKSYATAIVRDMTTSLSEIIQTENDLSALVESTKQKSAFLATMSHEVRTPLTGIMGVADLLATEDLPPSVLQNIEIIRSCGKNLSQILNDILDLSKIDAGKMELHFEPFRPARLINDIKSVFAPIAATKKLQLVTTIKENNHSKLMGDPARIRQVLFNLVGNAVKFTENGSVIVEASIIDDSTNPKQAILRIDVIDSGAGIAEDKLESIFDEFEQADNTINRKTGGTGLGLAISKKLIAQMGGKLFVNSRLNAGSTFSFAIPLEVFIERRATPRLAPEVNYVGTAADNLNILLAEDFAVNQELIATMLKKNGHKVTLADDGKIALDKAKKKRYDLILMDIHMPNLNGIDSFKIIRRDSLNMETPVIAITADVMVENVRELKQIGFANVVAKPIDWDDLTQKIRAALGSSSTEKPTV